MEAVAFCPFVIEWIELESQQFSMSLETPLNIVRPATEMDALMALRPNIIPLFQR